MLTEKNMMDIHNQTMCLVSQKTQMPLCAVTLKFPTADGHQKRQVISLGLKDALGNVWHRNGKGSLEDACNWDLSQNALASAREKHQHNGVFDVVYTTIEELQQIDLINLSKLNNPRNAAHHFSEMYIQQHTPPMYEGLDNIHQHFRTYMQGECLYYAIALSDLINKKPCAIHIGDALHYAVHHDDGDVEDIWGKRSLATIVSEFTNSQQEAVISSVDPGSMALLKSVKFGEINKAKYVVKSNPRHQCSKPVYHPQQKTIGG